MLVSILRDINCNWVLRSRQFTRSRRRNSSALRIYTSDLYELTNFSFTSSFILSVQRHVEFIFNVLGENNPTREKNFA